MIVPDEIRKCVVFIGYGRADGSRVLAGTGFLVARPLHEGAILGGGATHPSFGYLLTAKHVIDSIRDLGLSEVLVRLNYRDGKARWTSVPISLWLNHPTEPDAVDVSIILASGFPVRRLDQRVFPIAAFATKDRVELEEIGLGEEIVVAGLFAPHHGTAKNIPIVRIGTIAAMPEEKVITKIGPIDAYLVEARSIGGLSGSPVFVNMGIMRDRRGVLNVEKRVNNERSTGAIYLLGLMHGHYDEQKVNMGIGIVVPATKILEVVNQEATLTQERLLRELHARNTMAELNILPDDVEGAVLGP
jgi:hypothetical protein